MYNFRINACFLLQTMRVGYRCKEHKERIIGKYTFIILGFIVKNSNYNILFTEHIMMAVTHRDETSNVNYPSE